MTRVEIDIMWQQAIQESIKDGEMFTRYHFAKLVAEKALADPMRDVQRLGQEIEQEPVAWMWNNHGSIALSRFQKVGWQPLFTTPPQRTWVGLTNQEQLDIFAQSVAKKRSEHQHYMAIEQALKEQNQ